MFLALLVVEAVILGVLLCIGFVTSFDIKGNLNWKQWLQVWAGSLMLAAILPLRGNRSPWRFHKKTFLVGAVIFLSTFIPWKRNENDQDSD
jgi:peptidoglycan/LPS O-acetylase OafA/YrhL